MMALRSYATLPSIQSGYELDDVFSVVVPVARVNEVLNPSGETNTTGYTAGAGTLTRSTEQQYHGAYSFKYVPSAAITDGFYYGTVTMTAGENRAISCKFLGQAGVPYILSVNTGVGFELTATAFVATGRWQWVVVYYQESATNNRRIYFRKNNSANVGAFYVDGVQSEVIQAGETVSTYLDGDQLGFVPNQSPVPYYWNGTPHASTSARSGLTRAGGMVVRFKDFGFLLTAIIGLGLAAPQNAATEYARIDGGYDDYTRKPTRQFTLSGQFQAGLDYLQLRQQRGGLSRLLDRDLVGQDQRLLLRREVIDPCGTVQSSTCRVVGKYQGGLSGNTDNQTAEQAAITFTQYLATVLADGESGGALNVQASVANANAIVKRGPDGVWSALSTGMTSGASPDVAALAQGLDGKIYAGGTFTGAGASGADYIASWDGAAWSVLGSATAINNLVYAIAVGPDGAIYAGGAFTNAGGVAAADYIAKWNGSAWSALGTGGDAPVRAIVFGADGTLYAGGAFTSMGGVANTNGIAKWNGSAWSALGTGAGVGGVDAIAARGTTVIAGGGFASMGGVANTLSLAKWDGSAWSSMSTGMGGGSPNALAFAPNGTLYIGGSFTTINSLSIPYLALWNGVAFTGGVTLDLPILAVIIEANGVGHIGGQFTTVNGITYPDRMARFVGNTALTPEDVDLPGAALVESFLTTADGSLYVGFAGSGTATAAGTTIITNTGTARSYPTIRITGPSSGAARIYSLMNATTNRAIYLNLTISAGETVMMVFVPDNLSFTSTFQGDIASSILAGSNVADFFLQPGANTIAFLSASSTVTATLYFRPAFVSLDDVP